METLSTVPRAARRTKKTGCRIGALYATLMRGYFGALRA